MEKELAYLGKAGDESRAGPFVRDYRWRESQDKIEVVENLMKIADAMLIGGGMAYTFFEGAGLADWQVAGGRRKLDLARKILRTPKRKTSNFCCRRHVDCPEFKADAPATIYEATATPADQMGLDIGRKRSQLISSEISKAKTIVWNAYGRIRMPRVCKRNAGSRKQSRRDWSRSCFHRWRRGFRAAAHQSGVADKISHISTGASVARISGGRKLPGVEALTTDGAPRNVAASWRAIGRCTRHRGDARVFRCV